MTLTSWLTGRWVETFELANDDIVVFVVGPSGAGKSLFVQELTKSNLVKVSANLRPCSARVQAIRCKLTDEARTALLAMTENNIVFVDTPSFLTGQNDGAAEKEMNDWLRKSKSKSIRVGTIFMHRVETDPHYASPTVQDHLNAFAFSFPQNFITLPQRVHGVLSYEGVICDDTIRARRATFQAQLGDLRSSQWPGGILRWVTSFHSGLFKAGDSETAWRAVVELFAPDRTDRQG